MVNPTTECVALLWPAPCIFKIKLFASFQRRRTERRNHHPYQEDLRIYFKHAGSLNHTFCNPLIASCPRMESYFIIRAPVSSTVANGWSAFSTLTLLYRPLKDNMAYT